MGGDRDQLEIVIQTGIDSALKDLHTCLPGQVISFTPATQLADIQISIKRKIKGTLVNLPVLKNVPVRYQKSSGFSITFPLSEGDEVLLLFSERSLDVWLESGGIQDPFDVRKHSLSDAFAIPMMYNQGNVISNFDADNIQIRNTAGDGFFSITPGGDIHLNGDADTSIAFTDMQAAFNTFRTEFNALVTAFNAHLHSGVTTGAGSSGMTSISGVPAVADMSGAEVPTVKVP